MRHASYTAMSPAATPASSTSDSSSARKNWRRIAHGAVLVRAERARAVHVRLDGDPLARPIAARAPGARVVRLEQHAPSGRRIVRARRRSHAVVHHAPDRVLVEMLALPPVARPVPGHGRRVAHPGHAPRPCAHAAATRLVRAGIRSRTAAARRRRRGQVRASARARRALTLPPAPRLPRPRIRPASRPSTPPRLSRPHP